MDTEFDVGKRLIKLRELKQLTTNKLAYNSGLAQSFVRDVENGNKMPTVKSLIQLCDALGITVKDFFDDGVIGSIEEDPLLLEVYRLSAAKREKLTEFLQII